MNQWHLLFRTFLQNRSITLKHQAALLALATLILVAISCQLRDSIDDPLQASSELGPAEPKVGTKTSRASPSGKSSLGEIFGLKPKFLSFYIKKDNQFIQAVEVQDTWCSSATPSTVHWRLTLTSLFGTFPVEIESVPIANTPGKHSAKFLVDGRRFDLADFPSLSAETKSALCGPLSAEQIAAAGSDPKRTLLPNEDLKIVRNWLHSTSPDCAFTSPSEKGWMCNLPTADPLTAETSLNAISKTLVEKWNRQPYLFTRRLMVSTTLARAIMSTNPNSSLDRFCRVLELSLPQEVPLAFDSVRWRKGVCDASNELRSEIAAIGLAKAHSELSFLKLLLERTSTLGTLTIRVPRNQAPEGELMVNLSPAKEVTDSLVAESARIWSKEGVLAKPGEEDDESASAVQNQPLPMACWHPMFGESSDLIRLSKYLSLSGNAAGLSCHTDTTGTDSAVLAGKENLGAQTKDLASAGIKGSAAFKAMAPERYIAESIASETEFTITNGKSKVLRLPQGTYNYIIYSASDASEDADIIPENKSGGTILWSKKGTRPLINSWQSSVPIPPLVDSRH